MEYKVYKDPRFIDPRLNDQLNKLKENEFVECEQKVAILNTPDKNNRIYTYYSKACIICGDGVRLTDEEVMSMKYGRHLETKICDKCKQAILHIRKQLDE